jgi:glycosyltransferase involved in cell wall biosynthesis
MHLLYLTTSFRSLTLTFVTREVDELRRLGHRVELLSLRRDAAHEAARPECDLDGALDLLPVTPGRLLRGLWRMLVTRPDRLLGALTRALTSPGDRTMVRLKLVGQLAATCSVVETVESLGVEHIHAHLASPPGSYALFLSVLTGLPFSFTGHAADLYRRPEALRLKLATAAGVVSISEYNQRFYRRLRREPLPDPVIHCGIRLEDFPYVEREPQAPPLRILAVGRAAEKKGFRHLLDALPLVSAAGVDWTGHLVGGGPLLDDLREQAAVLGLDALEIAGPRQQDEVRALLAAADVFVLPCVEAADGDIDGIPVALMEAMASGCPVVSTRLSGIPELVRHEETGLLAAPGDAGGLATCLVRLARDPALARRLAGQGRAHVERRFNLSSETRKLADFFAAVSGPD